MHLPALFWGSKNRHETGNLQLVNEALLLLPWLEREHETPLRTDEVLASYELLKQMDKQQFDTFLKKYWFALSDHLSFNWFKHEILHHGASRDNWLYSSPHYERASVLSSFLLQQILTLARFIKSHKITAKKKIDQLVLLSCQNRLHTLSPGWWNDMMLQEDKRTKKITWLSRNMQHDLQTTLLWPGAWTNRWISRIDPAAPIEVGKVHGQVLDQEAKHIEFLILAFIFKTKDILSTFLLWYAQNPSFFDDKRPFTISRQKKLEE